jgi:hypothetical protein
VAVHEGSEIPERRRPYLEASTNGSFRGLFTGKPSILESIVAEALMENPALRYVSSKGQSNYIQKRTLRMVQVSHARVSRKLGAFGI